MPEQLSPLAERLLEALPSNARCTIARAAHQAGIPSGLGREAARELVGAGLVVEDPPRVLRRSELNRFMRTRRFLEGPTP